MDTYNEVCVFDYDSPNYTGRCMGCKTSPKVTSYHTIEKGRLGFMSNGRPISDSPQYVGPLYLIEIPDRSMNGGYKLHAVSTTIKHHQNHLDRLHNSGHHDVIERRINK